MNDTTAELVRKLRARIQRNHVTADKWAQIPDPLCQSAADEIERFEVTLQEIAGLTQFVADDAVSIARCALGLKEINDA